MAAAMWGDSTDSSLADLKSRLEKLRVDQARQPPEDETKEEIDTLKLLEAKFGSPVYDPTSPQQIAYARRCARAGRRQSIEFEDLYITKGAQQTLRPPTSHYKSSGGTGVKRTPSLKSSVSGDHSPQHPPSPLHPHNVALAHERQRKSSDPTVYWRRLEKQAPETHAARPRKTSIGSKKQLTHPDLGGHDGHEASDTHIARPRKTSIGSKKQLTHPDYGHPDHEGQQASEAHVARTRKTSIGSKKQLTHPDLGRPSVHQGHEG